MRVQEAYRVHSLVFGKQVDNCKNIICGSHVPNTMPPFPDVQCISSDVITLAQFGAAIPAGESSEGDSVLERLTAGMPPQRSPAMRRSPAVRAWSSAGLRHCQQRVPTAHPGL